MDQLARKSAYYRNVEDAQNVKESICNIHPLTHGNGFHEFVDVAMLYNMLNGGGTWRPVISFR